MKLIRRTFCFGMSLWVIAALMSSLTSTATAADERGPNDREAVAFFEKKIRPLLVQHCYECHSEAAEEQQGGLLLDRRSGWIKGGETGTAVVPGDPDASLLIKAVRKANDELQMPPDGPLTDEQVVVLEDWVRRGAPGPADDLGETEFSRLGDQNFLFEEAKQHWAFQPVVAVEPPVAANSDWNQHEIDRFVFAGLANAELTPSAPANPHVLIRRLTYDLTGLPPTMADVESFVAAAKQNRPDAIRAAVDRLIDSPAFGEHIGRMWLDVARYADTDSFYRPDTKTPHYFPFAFTYRDYVIEAFNTDKPFDQFVREQLAADLLDLDENAPEMAALGFLAVGPHANRSSAEALDDWIDVTTRGLMGITAACARCHDHKYEPIPTADYYALRGVFDSIERPSAIDESLLPELKNYAVNADARADYEQKRAAIDAKITKAGGKKSGGNNRPIAQKIRETELAELLLFHPGAPVHTMVVHEKKRPAEPVIFIRGNAGSRGDAVPRRFLKVLDPKQPSFPADSSGRLQLADKIVSPDNPLTSRVFVNRVWGLLLGRPLVETTSDFGLQGAPPTHPQLLDWLAADFVAGGWSVKRLVRTIVLSQTYQQASADRAEMAAIDPVNHQLWRAHRKHLSIEAIRDSLLHVSQQLDRTARGRAAPLWDGEYTRRRAIYGYINRFNLDPTLRIFDFPTPMQTQPSRDESIVAPQSLFVLNSPFVIDQAVAATELKTFADCQSDAERVEALFTAILQRRATRAEIGRINRFVEVYEKRFAKAKGPIDSSWPLVAQALMMSNEFQYVD